MAHDDDTPTVRWYKKLAKQPGSAKYVLDSRRDDNRDTHMRRLHGIALAAGFSSWAVLLTATEDERQAGINRIKATATE